MSQVQVKNLVKIYKTAEKEPGLTGSIKSLFHRKYNEIKAVNNVSFNVEEGELIGFIGPNGAGKTTTLKCLTGLLYPTSGQISVLGNNPWERKTEFLKNIAFVMGQKNQLWWDLPPMETFILNKEIYEIDDHKFKETLADLSGLLDAGEILKTPTKKLSLGQRMKCELIVSLLHKPKILFLDEPTIGLDVVVQKKLREFINLYNQKYKSTIILTSHYMKDVEALAQRVIIINAGKILYDGKLSNLVKKFSPYKLISVIFTKPVDQNELSKLGKIKSYDFPKLSFSVKSKDANVVASKILSNLPVEDINIEEADIEDVIRLVFAKNE